MSFKIAVVISLLFILVTARAQNNRFQFSQLDINNGLSHSQVNCIFKDSKGFMWYGTASGLNKYDGYRFRVFKHDVGDTTSLDDDFIISIAQGPGNKLWIQTRNGFNIYDPSIEGFSHNIKGYLQSIGVQDQYIASVKKDKSGNYWFLHLTAGVYRYNPALKHTTHFTHNKADSTTISSNTVSDLAQDSRGNVWLVYKEGVLEKLDPHKNYKVTYRARLFDPLPVALNTNYKIYVDKQDDIWAFVSTYSSGVYYVNNRQQIFKHITKGSDNLHLNTDVISNVVQDDKGLMWIATDHGGINLLNKKDFTVSYLLNREDDHKTIAQNSTVDIYKDNTNIIWIGTYKHGLSYYHPDIVKFTHFTHHLSDPSSLSFSDINCFAEDRSNNLWIGTNGGGLIYFNRSNGTFKTFVHNAADPNSLTNNVIVCMYLDHEQKLWLGTYFGGLDCFDGKTFKHYRHNDAIPGSISEDRICAIHEDADHNLWVGTLSAGLNEMDPERKSFFYKVSNTSEGLHSNYVSALLEDRSKNLWIVTSFGVDVRLKKTGKFIHYIHDEKDPNSLINNNTNNILQDSRGLIWISTREGISVFNPATGKFTNIYKQDGLPDNTVIDMQEDNMHNIWASTTNGLCDILVSKVGNNLKFGFINYNEADGLQGHEFNENSSLKCRNGELVFGGGNGFNIFKPWEIGINKEKPQVVLTDFQVFNQEVHVGEKIQGRVILPQSITGLNSLKLKYNANVFSISFAALNYFNPDKVKYQYMMEGFDKDWINADGKIRMATYTNLDPGDYIFKVRATTNNHWDNSKVTTLHLSILPPFWKTIWAYAFYGILLIGILLYIRKRGHDKLRTQFVIEKEREEARRMHELDLMKIKFFTNVSHEFRTPLSLIMAPVDKLMKQSEDINLHRQLEMINRNAKRLLNMVNQLLDFRKLEHHELQLHSRPGDIVAFVKDLCYSFTDIADQKNIHFVFDSEVAEFNTNFDHDKIERILFNLLSNAYKFTPQDGSVSVLINIANSGKSTLKALEIKVIDTGIGIPAEKIQKIFEPFYQGDIPGSMLNQGSGIGLSITKEFVKLHNGEISVESEVNQGTTFTLLLNLKHSREPLSEEKPILVKPAGPIAEVADTKPAPKKDRKDQKKPTVLLVEDNADFRFYLKDNLKDTFNIIEAENGKKGWQKALAQHPNLIVSDITMPEMTGSELCIKIKHDPRTKHIPVVLLTAMTGEEQQLKALETGATDYMTKPFNFEILLSKIRNILDQQETMRKTYQKQVEAKPTEMQVESPDEQFIKKVLVLIDNNISNPNFSVEELSSDMFVSRYTLYKKILTMTGKTPNELVRSMRLKRAAQLIESGHLTISQICNKVGFKSQKYFVKQFKAEFNTIPSKYVETVEQD